MPKTKLDAANRRVQQEKLAVLITGAARRRGGLGKTASWAIDRCVSTALEKFANPGKLTVDELVKLSRRLDIPADVIRDAITF